MAGSLRGITGLALSLQPVPERPSFQSEHGSGRASYARGKHPLCLPKRGVPGDLTQVAKPMPFALLRKSRSQLPEIDRGLPK